MENVVATRPVRAAQPVLPRDVALACATGVGLGGFGLGAAFALHARAEGPTWMAVSLLPLSMLLVGALYLFLVRHRHGRASDWLALGYTAAVVVATLLLTLLEAGRELYAEMNVGVW